jgi:hypothetical protein
MGTKPPPLENSSIDEAMDGDKTSQKQMEANLDVMVQMTSYDPFETLAQQGVHIEGVSTLRPTQYFREANLRVEIAKHVFEGSKQDKVDMKSKHLHFNCVPLI